MNETPGSLLGGALLIAGSCIGAGMLALPILTGLSGFFPSLFFFFCTWIFMTLTGLLLVEVNSAFPTQVNFISMVRHSLGNVGKSVCWATYLFLFYALLVAYISVCGTLFSSFSRHYFDWKIPDWAGSIAFVLFFGWIIYRGTSFVDWGNRILMIGKIGSFLILVLLGMHYVSAKLLMRSDPLLAFCSLPILVISFGFHNVIPSLMEYMRRDVKRVRLSILLGSTSTLVVYIIWQVIVLGIVPLEGSFGILESLQAGKEASQAISGILGFAWMSRFATIFAFFAILTSFLTQTLSLTHFWADGLQINYQKKENLGLCLLSLFPPLLFSILYPQVFFRALNFAGGICAVILFGVLPILMAWKSRKAHTLSSYQCRGGSVLLLVMFLFAIFISFFQLSQMFFTNSIIKCLH